VPQEIEPVTDLAEGQETAPEDGIGLAVSGGGYRAMLFHLGALLRLFELNLLQRLDRISSVSGGSITCAKLALEWPRIDSRDAFFAYVVGPIRALAGITIDVPSVIFGLLLPGHVSGRVSRAYRKHLFGDATLQDLPNEPRFVINASNLETGTLWRFSKPYMADYRVGRVENPTVSLADAVTASSAFPPILSPFVLDVEAKDFTHVVPGVDRALLDGISLTDGGVYDNLGLETVWKRYRTVLVSDAGGVLAADASPPADWARLSKRVIEIIRRQAAALRRQQLIASYKDGRRTGAYWGMGTDIADFALADALAAPRERTLELAATRTRLKRLDAERQERLINWGYAACDAAVRRHYLADAPAPFAYPYPAAGV
jgi:NTE family protein